MNSFRRRWYLLILSLCASFVIFPGCATTYRNYSGDPLPRDKVAVLVTRHAGVRVSKLDGYPARPHGKGLVAAWFKGGLISALDTNEVEILPGKHELQLDYGRFLYTRGNMQYLLVSEDPITVRFEAEAGRRYRVVGTDNNSRWTAWVEEVTKEFSEIASSEKRSLRSEGKVIEAFSSDAGKGGEITITYPDGTIRKIPSPGAKSEQ